MTNRLSPLNSLAFKLTGILATENRIKGWKDNLFYSPSLCLFYFLQTRVSW